MRYLMGSMVDKLGPLFGFREALFGALELLGSAVAEKRRDYEDPGRRYNPWGRKQKSTQQC